MTGGQAALYDVTYTDVLIYSGGFTNDTFEPMNVGTNTKLINFNNNDEFGCEASFFKNMQAYAPTQRRIIKLGDGGTSLATRWLSPGDDWGFLMAYINDVTAEAGAAGIKYDLKAFIWMQGEEDATNLTNANAYEANLGTFFSDFDSVWSAKCSTYNFPDNGYKKVIGRLTNATTDSSQVYLSTVRTAQANYCANPSNNAILIDTDAYTLFDGVHFDATSQIQFGIDIFNQIKDL